MHGMTCAAKASFSSIASHSSGATPVRADELAHRGDRPETHVIRMHAGRRRGDDASERAQPQLRRLLARGDDERRGAVVDPR